MKPNRSIHVILLLFFVLASCSGGGGGAAAPVTPPAKKIVPKYVYVANLASGTISELTIDATSGKLTYVTYISSDPIGLASAQPTSIAVVPSDKYAYVSNSGTNNISQFTIGTDGSLTAMLTPTISAGSEPISVAVDPSGKYLYVANHGVDTTTDIGNVSQYSIQSDGSLTAMSTPTISAGINPQSLAVDLSGQYLYVVNSSDNTVSQFIISSLDGSLTPMTTPVVPSGTTPWAISIDPTNKYVYVANYCGSCGSYDVSQYTIGLQGSLPTSVTTTATAGTNPYSIAVDPTGKYVYVANIGGSAGSLSGTLSQYTIASDGSAVPMSSPTADTQGSPTSVTVDPSGKYVYATNAANNTVSQFSIGTNGNLSSMSPSTVDLDPLSAGTSQSPSFIVTVGALQ